MALPAPTGIQREVVALPAEGHVVVLGTAGSGKTTMAIHRAANLSNPGIPNSGRTLLVTFNRTLVQYIDYLAGADLARVDVCNYHRFARGYLAHRGKMGNNSICKPQLRRAVIGEAVEEVAAANPGHPLFTRPVEFFSDEIAWVNQHGFVTEDAYIAADRIGRVEAKLRRDQRPLMFAVYAAYARLRKEQHAKDYDWDDMAVAVRTELLSDDSDRLYRHIVIDEGQDFSPEMIRSMVAAVPPDGSVTLFGDVAQQIYGRRLSWKDAGLKIEAVWQFRKNYRNSREIAALGLAIAAMPYFGDEPDMVAPDEFRAAGPLPTLVRLDDESKELAFAVAQARAAAAAGQEVGILLRRHEYESRVERALGRSQSIHTQVLSRDGAWRPGAGISYGTIHSAKGLEFDTVIVPFLTDVHYPDPAVVEAAGADEAAAIDGRLLYVAITRARSSLIVTCSGELTRLMPTDTSLWQEAAP